jgi:hypothetical protein
MRKSALKKLQILENFLWSIFFFFVLFFINGYIKEKGLIFYKLNHTDIVYGSSWGMSASQIEKKSRSDFSKFDISYAKSIFINGDSISYNDDIFKKIKEGDFDYNGYSAKIDYFFFNDQLFAIQIKGTLPPENVFKKLVTDKFGELKDNSDSVSISFKTKLPTRDVVELSGGKFYSIENRDLVIHYMTWVTDPTNPSFFISIIYKPLLKEIKWNRYKISN